MTTYVALAISDAMFPQGSFEKSTISSRQAKKIVEGEITSCVNPAHQATIQAIRQRYNIELPVPDNAPKVLLKTGDQVLVCSVRGLPRQTREFTKKELAGASFTFSLWRCKRRRRSA